MFSIGGVTRETKSSDRPIDRVLEKAEERGWNQTDLAEKLGVTSGAITNWIARGDIPARQHKKVADLFGWTVDQLLHGIDSPNRWPFADTVSLAEFDELDADDKRQIREHIEDRVRRFKEKNGARRRKKISEI